MTTQFQPEDLQPAPTKLPSIKLVAAGGAGLKILDQLIRAGLPPTAATGIHSDTQALAASQAGEKLALNSTPADLAAQTNAGVPPAPP
jgi:cell division GTPase FtsZ